MDKPIEHDMNQPRQRVTAVDGAEVLLDHRRAAQDPRQRKAAAQFAQRAAHAAADREGEPARGAPARLVAASLGALFRDEALRSAHHPAGEPERDPDQGGGNEDRSRADDGNVEQQASPKARADPSPAAGASGVQALEQAKLALQQTLAGPSIDRLAREIAHCVQHSSRMRAGQWQMTLRLKPEILPETELEMKGNGYRLDVLLRIADAGAYRLAKENKEELDELLRKRGATDVQTRVAFEPLAGGK